MIVIPTGFFNTGSSAITHLLLEMDNVENMDGVYEMRILFDPDCIRDLEYHLIENPHRQNTSYAIKRFKKYIDFNSNLLFNHHYEKLCKGNFRKISHEYIHDICDFKYYGNGHIDSYSKGGAFYFAERCIGKITRTFFTKNRPAWVRGTLLPKNNVQYGGTYDRDKFIYATRNYIGRILKYCNPQDKKWLVLDQFLPTTGIKTYLNYFPLNQKVKVFIVDRDPRDLYITCKYFLHSNIIPINSVEIFCDWFLWTRGQSQIQNRVNNIFWIQFEDLIYEYDSTRKKIFDICEIKTINTKKQFSYFDPMKSINNTQLWLRYPESINEAKIIQKRLPAYCYPFDEKSLHPDIKNGKVFDC